MTKEIRTAMMNMANMTDSIGLDSRNVKDVEKSERRRRRRIVGGIAMI
jgi:hypothetical protein